MYVYALQSTGVLVIRSRVVAGGKINSRESDKDWIGTHPVSRWKGRRPWKPGRLVTDLESEEAAAKAIKKKQTSRSRRSRGRPIILDAIIVMLFLS